jgi:cytidylate kinase
MLKKGREIMAIITISRGSFSRGREVAERVAKKLDYEVVSREIILETSKDFNIPEIKLIRAIHDAPSFLERFTFGRERYLAHIASTLLDHMEKDHIVYHGLAGHFFVKHISHVLKVRIIADREERLKIKMEREKTSREKALEALEKDDHERRQWSLKLYGVDTWDPSLYDLVLHIHKLTVENAADLICHTVQLEQFKPTPESQQAMADLALAARVKAQIVEKYPVSKVTAREGEALVDVQASETLTSAIEEEIGCLVGHVAGLKKVKVHVVPATLFDLPM